MNCELNLEFIFLEFFPQTLNQLINILWQPQSFYFDFVYFENFLVKKVSFRVCYILILFFCFIAVENFLR